MKSTRFFFRTASYTLFILSTVFALNSLAEDRTGEFVDETAERLPVDTSQAARSGVGDIDVDGDIDILVATGTYTGLLVAPQDFLMQVNDGTGHFTNEAVHRLPETAFQQQYGAAAVLDDFDGDGDLDAFIANGTSMTSVPDPENYQNWLWINDGNGIFTDETDTRLPAATNPSLHAAIGDIDNDGDVDIIVGNVHKQNRVLINNGSGNFFDQTVYRLPLVPDITLAVVLSDLDYDNDLDLVVANRWYGGSKILINNGIGAFTDESALRFLESSAPWAGDIKVADLNDDGFVDIMFSSIHGGPLIFINDGNGYFADESLERTPMYDNSHGLTLADVDRDGDIDAFVSLAGYQQSVLLSNDGNGYFSDVTSTLLPSFYDSIRYPSCGDVDNDGDPDLYLGVTFNNETYHQDRLLINAGSPAALVEELNVTMHSLGLPRGTERKLISRLEIAQHKLTNNNANDDLFALRFLEEFIAIVNSQPDGVISPENAAMLIGSAEEIIDRLIHPAKCVS